MPLLCLLASNTWLYILILDIILAASRDNQERWLGCTINGTLALKTYQKWHNKALNTHSRTVDTLISDLNRYIHNLDDITVGYIIYVASPEAGLGNRLLGLLSSLLLALLTNRVLLVDFYDYNIDDLLKSNFIPRWSIPRQKFSWSTIRKRSKMGIIDATKTNSSDCFKLASLQLENNGKGITSDFVALIDLSKVWKGIQIISVTSNTSFIPLLVKNPHFANRIKEWFFINNIMGTLANLLLVPHPVIELDIMATMHSFKGRIPLAFQYRSFTGIFNFTHLTEMISCARTVIKNESHHIFVASLHEEAKFALHKALPLATIIQKYPEGHQRRGLQQARKALHDIILLSTANQLIITQDSTIGLLALSLWNINRFKSGSFIDKKHWEGITCSKFRILQT